MNREKEKKETIEKKKVSTEKGENKKSKKLYMQILDNVVSEKPNVKWISVAGLDKEKEALKEILILPIKLA